MKKRSPKEESRQIRELTARIRAANPTGRGLRARAERERYEEKARLQSRLVEDHGAAVTVRFHADMPGVVSLAVPSLDESAGHAIVEDLSDWAQGWIAEAARAADIDAARPGRPANQLLSSHDEGVLDRALRYIREFDFDCAERDLRFAVESASTYSPADRVWAVETLVELLVDQLGRDDDALALMTHCDDLAVPSRVHRLLGVAAARVGRLDVAVDRLGRAPSPESASELATVVRSAVDAESYRVARDALRVLRRMEVSPGIEVAVKAARRTAEASARAFLDSATMADFERLDSLRELAEIVAPDHPVLREQSEVLRLRREREERQKHVARLAELSVDAEHADEAELERLIRALSPAVLGDDERALLTSCEAMLKARRLRDAVNRVELLHANRELEAAALAFLRLAPEGRSQLRAPGSGAFFEVVTFMAASTESAHATARAAAAWEAALRETNARRAWEIVAPFAALLARSSELASRLEELRTRGASCEELPPEPPRAFPSTSRRTRALAIAERSAVTNEESLLVTEEAVRADQLLPRRRSHRQREERGAGGELVAVEERATITRLGQGVDKTPESLSTVPDRTMPRFEQFVVALHQLRPGEHELWVDRLDAATDHAHLSLRILSVPTWAPVSVASSDGELLIIDATARTHILKLGSSPCWMDGPILDVVERCHPMACHGARLISLTRSNRGDTGSVLHGATRPAIVVAQGDRLTVHDGSPRRTFIIPRGLHEFVAIESPFGVHSPPLLLERARDEDARPMIWWSADDSFWRGVRLREALTPHRALTLPGRGVVLLATQARSLVVQRVVVHGRRLERGLTSSIEGGIAIVRDRTHRRVSSVRLTPSRTGLDVQSLSTTSAPEWLG